MTIPRHKKLSPRRNCCTDSRQNPTGRTIYQKIRLLRAVYLCSLLHGFFQNPIRVMQIIETVNFGYIYGKRVTKFDQMPLMPGHVPGIKIRSRILTKPFIQFLTRFFLIFHTLFIHESATGASQSIISNSISRFTDRISITGSASLATSSFLALKSQPSSSSTA